MQLISLEKARELYPDQPVFQSLASSNELNDFAVAWTGNQTDFKLQQLAAVLIPRDRERSRQQEFRIFESAQIWIFIAAVFCGICNGVAAGVINQTPGASVGVGLLSVLGFSFVLYMTVAMWFLFRISWKDSRPGAGDEPAYKAAIERFSEALYAVSRHLNVGVDAFNLYGHKRVAELARDQLTDLAVEIEELQCARDHLSSRVDYETQELAIRRLLAKLGERYDDFVALKLEKREYDAIFADAKRRLSEGLAA